MKHFAGHYYHVYNRGVSRKSIFLNAENYRFLVRRAKQYLPLYDLKVIAYCLMPNHYHFLLRPETDHSLSPFIQRLFNSYTQAFNRQQQRKGTLFEGRVKSKLVDKDDYLLHLTRYIHLNPVEAGLVSHPGDWLYSNYLEWIGKRDSELCDPQFIENFFSTPSDYEAFTLADISPEVQKKLAPFSFD
jgi:REP element-mobilizing transposase RayT